MSGKMKITLAIACVLAAAACIDSGDYEPTSPTPVDVPVPTKFLLSPDSASVQELDQFQLTSELRDQSNHTMIFQPTATYSSSDTSVAKVTSKGFVTAMAPGRAVITAKTFLAQPALSDSTVVTVYKASLRAHPAIDALTNGWSPNVVRIRAGDGVEWHSGLIATSGTPVTSVWLWNNADPVNYDEVTFTDGVGRRTFANPGTYTYCSGGCWDPPEFGTIIVE